RAALLPKRTMWLAVAQPGLPKIRNFFCTFRSYLGAAQEIVKDPRLPSVDRIRGRFEANMIEVFKEFTFEAAHRIAPYSDVHGHSFSVEITLRGAPDPEFGWVTSLSEVDPRVRLVQQALDHKYLNDVEGLEVPS